MRKSSNSLDLRPDLDLFEADTYVSVQLKGSQGLLLASVCSSKAFLSGGFHLFHFGQLLLNSSTEVQAASELQEKLFPEILHLSSNLVEPIGSYSIELPLTPDEKSDLAALHLIRHTNNSSAEGLPTLLKTVRDYRFLLEFGVTNPSVLLAGIYRVQVKTVHQRLYLARSQGLIGSSGRGRTQSRERS